MAENEKAAMMDEFRQTPYYQGLGIEALQEQLAGYQADEGALSKQAEAQYRPVYEKEREAAEQAFEKEMAGYRSELAGAGAAYDRQRRGANQAYDESAVRLNNELTRRGLGRSSLVSAQGAYLQKERNQALADIDRAENDAISAINEKIALLTEQAAQNERTMAGNYARQLENRVNEMKEKNRSASISLQLQIAALQQQGYEAYQDWLLKNRQQELKEKEFAAEYGGIGEAAGTGASSGGSGAKKPMGTASGKKADGERKESLSGAAGAAVNTLTDGIRKLLGGLSAGMQAAAAQNSGKKGAAGSLVGTKGGAGKIRQNAKE